MEAAAGNLSAPDHGGTKTKLSLVNQNRDLKGQYHQARLKTMRLSNPTIVFMYVN